MNREQQIALLETAIAMTKQKERPLGGEETTVPIRDYVDPARFERERERVFKRALNLVTLSTKVAGPGDFVTAEVVGTPVVVVRGEDGTLRAFLNVCRHRGATVELKPEGCRKRFVCPYHAWTYDNDGSLHRVRHPEGFPRLNAQQHGLVQLACVEAAGLVFVCPTPGVEPEPLPEALVEELSVMLGPRPMVYSATRRNWKANWKLIVEGGIESYHFRIAHKDTIAPFFGDTLSTYERIGAHMRSVLPKLSVVELEEVPRERWDIREHTHILYSLNPNAMVLLQKSHFDLILLTPLAVDSTRIDVWTVGRAPESGDPSAEARGFFERNHAISVHTLDEDFVIGEQIQRGIHTGANTHFRFARFEDALTDWHQRLDAALA